MRAYLFREGCTRAGGADDVEEAREATEQPLLEDAETIARRAIDRVKKLVPTLPNSVVEQVEDGSRAEGATCPATVARRPAPSFPRSNRCINTGLASTSTAWPHFADGRGPIVPSGQDEVRMTSTVTDVTRLQQRTRRTGLTEALHGSKVLFRIAGAG